VKELVKEKLELIETLQNKLKELKKAIEDTYSLHDAICENQLMITSLRSQEEWERKEKLELGAKIRLLEQDLRRQSARLKI